MGNLRGGKKWVVSRQSKSTVICEEDQHQGKQTPSWWRMSQVFRRLGTAGETYWERERPELGVGFNRSFMSNKLPMTEPRESNFRR